MSTVYTWKIDPATRSFELIQLHEPVYSLDGASNQLPEGAYTTFRTYDHHLIPRLEDHFSRLSLSAGLTNHVISIDEEMVRTALHHIIMLSSAQELRIRMILDLSIHPGEIFICTEPLRIPSAKDYEEGVNVVTIPMHRVNPRAKLTGFIHSASNIRATLPAGVNEALMVDENSMVLEGLSSNFFAVRNNSLWNAEEGVLPGITRCVVLAVAEQIGIPIILSPISVQEFETIDEAFITSTSRAILPVVSVDGKKIGDGKPGDITKELMVKFQEEIQAELEEI